MTSGKQLNLSELVQACITRTGLKQAQLADAIGIGQPTLNKWLNKKITKPDRENWDNFVAWGIKEPKVRDLFVSLDAIAAPYSMDTKRAAAEMLALFLRGRQ